VLLLGFRTLRSFAFTMFFSLAGLDRRTAAHMVQEPRLSGDDATMDRSAAVAGGVQDEVSDLLRMSDERQVAGV